MRRFYKQILKDDFEYKKTLWSNPHDGNLFNDCCEELKQELFQEHSQDRLFNFFIASITYHGDFIHNDRRLLILTPEDLTQEEGKHEAIWLYNYFEEGLTYSFKRYSCAKSLYKYFYENCSDVKDIKNQ